MTESESPCDGKGTVMETAPLKSFATWARTALIREVSARIAAVLAPASKERVESASAVTALERDIAAEGGGKTGRDAVADKAAYTWFNRIIALRFMDANGYTGVGIVSPPRGQNTGQPEVLADAKRGNIDPVVVTSKRTIEAITALLDGTRRSDDPQGEAYALLLAEYCRHWNRSMPFMFEREGDYTELLIPANLLADDSVLARAVTVLTEDVCRDVEVIGWLYQFYISERKDEVFAGFKKNKKAGISEIPAATQLFTPHWIVRYLVENSLGRAWMLNRPRSRLVEIMEYFIAPDQASDFPKIDSPEDLKIIDPACGSGHMLTYAFDLLYTIYEEEGYSPSEIPGLILTKNLFGLEIDQRAGALAAFALTMKARAKQRSFFSKQLDAHVCVLEPVRFTTDQVDFLLSGNERRADEVEFWAMFEHADTLGSLIKPDVGMVARLASHVTRLDDFGDLLQADVLRRARRVLQQATYLSAKYSVVVANPPYMGSRNLDATMSAWMKTFYANEKQDLYGCFVSRGRSLVFDKGLVAMIVGDTWMAIKSFEEFRKALLRTTTLNVLLHLHDVSNHPDVFGANTAFVLTNSPAKSGTSLFISLSDLGDESKKLKLAEAIQTPDVGWSYRIDPGEFEAIPGAPIAYGLPESVVVALAGEHRVGDVVSFLTSPHKTGENNRYVRRWWEVSASKVGSKERWVPYAKGGGARRWYGLMNDVLDWSTPALEFYSSNSSSNLMKRDPAAPEGITYSMLTSGTNTFRILPPGCAFDMGGPGFFPTRVSTGQALSLVNSDFSKMVLEALNPTMNLQIRDVKLIPVPQFSPDAAQLLSDLGDRAVSIARRDWDSDEMSADFSGHPTLRYEKAALVDLVHKSLADDRHVVAELTRIERRIDDIVWTAAGVDELHRGQEGKRAILSANPRTEFPAGKTESEYRLLAERRSVESLISYAIGVMFGRYSLDEPGLILADHGATLQDYLIRVPNPKLMPDADNVIPIVDGEWFEDDVVARLRLFLRLAFGEEHFDDNLRFVVASLGVNDLRDYFVNRTGKSKFYEDHVKKYKKPIYWLFSSPKGSFNALIYLHRYTPSTVSTVLNEYLREFKSKLEASRQHHVRIAASDGTPREKAAAEKEVDRLRKVLLELDEYEHDVLYPLATQQLAIDLDDGVKANYPKFYPALKNIPGLEATDE